VYFRGREREREYFYRHSGLEKILAENSFGIEFGWNLLDMENVRNKCNYVN